MTTVKTKKVLMYAVYVCVFVFGGIEYAVILPTIWLYLHNVYDAPEFMLGLVLSAYSLAAFFSSPVFGRIADRIGHTKQIFLVCATFELAGSFLYFIGISQWLCLSSRFISGMGAAAEAIALAEVSRYTSEQERTRIISNLVATRQIALLIGPGLNLFLRIADFKIGPFDVNKYTAPAAFMSVMWVLLMLVVLALYTEPKQIYTQEKLEQKRAAEQQAKNQVVSSAQLREQAGNAAKYGTDPSVSNYGSCSNPPHKDVQNHYSSTDKPPTAGSDQSVNSSDTLNQVARKLEESTSSSKKEFIQSDDGEEFVYPPLVKDQDRKQHADSYGDFVSENSVGGRILSINDGGDGRETPASLYASDASDDSGDFHDIVQTAPSNGGMSVSGGGTVSHSSQIPEVSEENDDNVHNTMHLSNSLDLLMSAERLIYSTQYKRSSHEVVSSGEVTDGSGSGLVFREDHFGHSSADFYTDVAGGSGSHQVDEKTPLMRAHQHNSQVSLTRTLGTNDPYIERSTSAFEDPIAIEGKLGFFCNEYIRDEIIAIVCLLFCAMFSQVCVETMVLPLSLKYLDFDELDNSLLYCGCGLEIILVFLAMSRLSRCLSDRVMMMFGAIMLLASNIWLITYLPNAPPHNRVKNIPFFAVAVFLDVMSLPFLIVCSTSLFSKLTRKQTQGLSQGLRRGVVGLGTVMAPMWGSSAVKQPYLLLGVLVGLQSISFILCSLSYKRLKTTGSENTQDIPPPVIASTNNGAINSKPQDQPPNYGSNRLPTPQQIQQPSTAHSTPYGSPQHSIAGSSYCSANGTSDEERPLLSHPVA